VNQISGTTHTDAAAQPHQHEEPGDGANTPESPGFQSRGRARRRARFLRKARELAYRDLGGLVFNLHRFGQRNDALVLAKLTTLGHIDAELRAIEGTLGEHRSITVLREAGITACPRCAAIHGSEDSFCPNCGLSLRRHVDLPIAGASAAPATAAAGAPSPPAQSPLATQPPTQPPGRATAAAPPPTPAPDAAPAAAASAISGPPPDHEVTVIEKATAGAEDGPTEILRPPGAPS
jgi:hypothetical protein